MRNINDTLFPTHPERTTEMEVELMIDIPLFSEYELSRASNSLQNRKAPGPDGIRACTRPSKLWHALVRRYSWICTIEGASCNRWKVQRLVLIIMGDQTTTSAYRLLCMLDTAGKLLERLLNTRLESSIYDVGSLHRSCPTETSLYEITEGLHLGELGRHSIE